MGKIAYTTVINLCGGKKHFSFLPPHGVELEYNGAICYRGEINDRLIPSWPHHLDKDRPPHPMKLRAIAKAEQNHELLVIRSVKPIYDQKLTKLIKKHKRVGYPDPNQYQSNPVGDFSNVS
jgi:hypothetical protein